MLRRAFAEYCWLLDRGYAEDSSIELVGNRHDLVARQRKALWRSACSEERLHSRRERCLSIAAAPDRLHVDGFNVLITLEAARGGAVVLRGRDAVLRDLAGIRGSYRIVSETEPVLRELAQFLRGNGAPSLSWYLDRPVSNSGRLRALLLRVAEEEGCDWQVELCDDPDRVLLEVTEPVLSADRQVLDGCRAWSPLVSRFAEAAMRDPFLVDLGSSAEAN